MWFNKYYRCSQGHEWQDEWDCLCNDRCPICNEETEPYDHAEIDQTPEDKAITDALVYGTGVVVHNYPLQSMNIPFIMLIRKDYVCETDREHQPTSDQRCDHPDQQPCADDSDTGP